MAKGRESSKLSHAHPEKEEKKKKTKRSDENGVHKSKDKKDKKEKKADREALAERALNEIKSAPAVQVKSDDEGEIAETDAAAKEVLRPVGALVPFANPLADEKVAKKVFKSVKKAAAQRTLKRGVKEVVKALRKSTSSSMTSSSSSSSSSSPIGVVILAADISPMDVISHIPVLCEDHNIPYIYVTSRAELGIAGQTKRPTSVVMVVGAAGKKKGKDGKEVDGEGDTAEWDEVFKGLVKTVEREGRHVKV